MEDLLPQEIFDLIFKKVDLDTLGRCYIAGINIQHKIINDYKKLYGCRKLERDDEYNQTNQNVLGTSFMRLTQRINIYRQHKDYKRFFREIWNLDDEKKGMMCSEFGGPGEWCRYVKSVAYSIEFMKTDMMRNLFKLEPIDYSNSIVMEFVLENYDKLQNDIIPDHELMNKMLYNCHLSRPHDEDIKQLMTFLIGLISNKIINNYYYIGLFFENLPECIEGILGAINYIDIDWEKIWTHLKEYVTDKLFITDQQIQQLKSCHNHNVYLSFIKVFPDFTESDNIVE